MALMEPSPVPIVADVIKDLPGSVMRAVRARSAQMIREADTMTLYKVRRLIEKDLNLEEKFLDAHKDMVKESIHKAMSEPEAESPKKRKMEKTDAEHANGKELEVESIADNKQTMKRLRKKSNIVGVKEEIAMDQVDDAGVSTNMTEEEMKDQKDDIRSVEKEVDMEALIQSAVHKRASQFRSQSESFTLSGVRRLLEEDLDLEKGALDAHKQFIRKLLDELLNSEEKEEPVDVNPSKKRKAAALETEKPSGAKSKEKIKKSVKKQKAAPVEEDEEDASSEDHGESHKVWGGAKSKEITKKSVKTQKATSVEEDEEVASEDHGDDEEPSEEEEGSGAETPDEEERGRKRSHKPKKVVEPKPAYGRKVENMKSIIKACGMTVPPNVYRKVKQASEEQREGVLLKELEAILKREGLSAGASKDEIKAVQKRKEKLKDLEGIDTSNIIVESRGRRAAASASNFFAPKHTEAADFSEDEEEEEEQESDSGEDPDVEPQEDEDEED